MFSQNKSYLFLVVIPVAVAIYFYNPFALYFQNDDFIHIPLSAKGVLLQHNSFRPVCDLSIALDYLLWGKNAGGYHFTNLLLHTISCIILFFFVRLVLTKYFQALRLTTLPFTASVLFFIYSSHSEAVFWILGRSAVLATIFSLLFLSCYLRRNESRKYVAGYILFFSVSLLTYESSWVLPLYCLVAGIVDIQNTKTNFKKEAIHFLILVIIFLVFLIVRFFYIHEVTGSYESDAFINGNYFELLKNYCVLVFRSLFPPLVDNKIIIACLIILNLSGLVIFLKMNGSERRGITILFFLFLISLLPYCSIGVDTHGTEGERFLYFPSIMLCSLYGFIFYFSPLKRNLQYIFYGALLVCHLAILFINATNYSFAGNINKSIVAELNKSTGTKTIYAINLPQSQNGALILRTGFPEMVKWLFEDKFDTAIVCSERSELNPLRNPYHVTYTKFSMSNCANSSSVNPSVIFRFTDSTLEISK